MSLTAYLVMFQHHAMLNGSCVVVKGYILNVFYLGSDKELLLGSILVLILSLPDF